MLLGFLVAALSAGTAAASTIAQVVAFARVEIYSSGGSDPTQQIGSVLLHASRLETNTYISGLMLAAILVIRSAYHVGLSNPNPLDYAANAILVETAPVGPAWGALVSFALVLTTALSLGNGPVFDQTTTDLFSAETSASMCFRLPLPQQTRSSRVFVQPSPT